MTLSNSGILAAVELPIYLIIAPFVIYLTIGHGRHGFLVGIDEHTPYCKTIAL